LSTLSTILTVPTTANSAHSCLPPPTNAPQDRKRLSSRATTQLTDLLQLGLAELQKVRASHGTAVRISLPTAAISRTVENFGPLIRLIATTASLDCT